MLYGGVKVLNCVSRAFNHFHAVVSQLAVEAALEAVCCGFESLRRHHTNGPDKVSIGSTNKVMMHAEEHIFYKRCKNINDAEYAVAA